MIAARRRGALTAAAAMAALTLTGGLPAAGLAAAKPHLCKRFTLTYDSGAVFEVRRASYVHSSCSQLRTIARAYLGEGAGATDTAKRHGFTCLHIGEESAEVRCASGSNINTGRHTVRFDYLVKTNSGGVSP